MKTLTKETINDTLALVLILISMIAITPFGWLFFATFIVNSPLAIVLSVAFGLIIFHATTSIEAI